jgi:hypothetical protein
MIGEEKQRENSGKKRKTLHLWGGRKVRMDSRRIETKRKFWEEVKDTSFVGREKGKDG